METLTAEPTVATSQMTVWANGILFDDPAQAQVSAVDHGFVVGDGVFEALKVTPAGAFAVRRHLDRLTRSARALGLPDPDHDLVRAGIDAVIEGRSYPYGKVRITYTGGLGPLGSGAATGPVNLVVAADVSPPAPPVTDIVTVPWPRNERGALAGVKSTSYAENVRGLAFATSRGASEAIFLNTVGHLCEGTGTNIFCVFGSAIVTPPLAAGPLAGITRDLLLAWTDVTEDELTFEEALSADEVFLTSSLRDIQGVRRWDEVDLRAMGPVTQRVAALFAERSTADLEP
jgi:branched-chain amino acid aminotransferase